MERKKGPVRFTLLFHEVSPGAEGASFLSSPASSKESEGFLERTDVVDSDGLDTLSRQGERAAESAEEARGFFVSQQFADEPLAGMADEEGLAEVVETVGIGHWGDVVLMRLPK